LFVWCRREGRSSNKKKKRKEKRDNKDESKNTHEPQRLSVVYCSRREDCVGEVVRDAKSRLRHTGEKHPRASDVDFVEAAHQD